MQTESTAVTTTEATHIDHHPVAVYLAGVSEGLGLMDIGGRSAGKENTANGKGKGIIACMLKRRFSVLICC